MVGGSWGGDLLTETYTSHRLVPARNCPRVLLALERWHGALPWVAYDTRSERTMQWSGADIRSTVFVKGLEFGVDVFSIFWWQVTTPLKCAGHNVLGGNQPMSLAPFGHTPEIHSDSFPAWARSAIVSSVISNSATFTLPDACTDPHSCAFEPPVRSIARCSPPSCSTNSWPP